MQQSSKKVCPTLGSPSTYHNKKIYSSALNIVTKLFTFQASTCWQSIWSKDWASSANWGRVLEENWKTKKNVLNFELLVKPNISLKSYG